MTGPTARLDLPLGHQAPSTARHAVHSVLVGWGFDDQEWLGSAAVVVSELVTNAVLHGGGRVELTVHLHDHVVTVSVADGSSVLPRHRPADETGGRGLALIDYLTSAWGVQDHEGGKRVWARLPPPDRTRRETV